MDGWENEWINRWMDGRIHVDGWMDGWKKEWTNRETDEWAAG